MKETTRTVITVLITLLVLYLIWVLYVVIDGGRGPGKQHGVYDPSQPSPEPIKGVKID